MGLFVLKNFVISSSKLGCNSFLPESKGHRCRKENKPGSLLLHFPPTGPLPTWPGWRGPAGAGPHRGHPEPSPKAATFWGCRGKFTPELPPALNRNSPERAKAEPAKLGWFDPNSAGSLEQTLPGELAWCRGCLRAQGSRLSSLSSQLDPLRLPEGKFLRERRPREMPGQEQPGKGSGVYLLQLLQNLSEQDFIRRALPSCRALSNAPL